MTWFQRFADFISRAFIMLLLVFVLIQAAQWAWEWLRD